MQLSALLPRLEVLDVQGDPDVRVAGVQADSREVAPGDVFVAIPGHRADGHAFLATVGHASAAVVERDLPVPQGVVRVRVMNARKALATLAAAFALDPAAKLRMIGVTGTNGKTTTTTLVDGTLNALGVPSGRIGTTGTFARGAAIESHLTTPDPVELHRLLAQMLRTGIEAVSMEVSSIGLHQHRVDGIAYSAAIFTNLTRDHLDYHGTMEEYAACKARLFRELLAPDGRPILYGDDGSWRSMAPPPSRWLYGRSRTCEIRIRDESVRPDGQSFTVDTPSGSTRVCSPLVGAHNALNLAAAIGAVTALGKDVREAAEAVGSVAGVSGRLERVPHPELLVLVDYAHTPDALDVALRAVRPWVRHHLWVVFGCGGDRDKGKRPLMGHAAEAGADRVVVTSDNPRHEDPQRIVDEILSGMSRSPAMATLDRRDAIRFAVREAIAGDVVLIAGKGHETTQQIGDSYFPFDDRRVAAELLEER